jgi:hypothetical protein
VELVGVATMLKHLLRDLLGDKFSMLKGSIDAGGRRVPGRTAEQVLLSILVVLLISIPLLFTHQVINPLIQLYRGRG